MKSDEAPTMEYRHLGPTGIKVSVISFGNWVNSHTEEAKQVTYDCIQKAWDLGINFFDTAEVYGFGQAEEQMGEGLRRLNVPRHKYVVSTKLFWGHPENLPNVRGLSRKHVIEGARRSLKKLGLEYVDILYCHRPDSFTPMQETCRAFDWLVRRGYTNYWGTSQWRADDIAQAHYICEKYGLTKPVVEQPEYNIYNRKKIELQFSNFFEAKKLGTTIWSPLLQGVLTGKYNKGVPEGARLDTNPQMKGLKEKYFGEKAIDKTLQKLNKFQDLANELGCSMAQLAMAWCINNPDISTAITGASSTKQLEDTIKAVGVRKLLTPEIQSRIEKIFETAPKGKMVFIKGGEQTSRRMKLLNYS